MSDRVFNTWFVRRFAVLIVFSIGVVPCLFPQVRTVSAHIEDAETGEALPFAHVIISERKRTLSNAEGDFSIIANAGDTLLIRYMGYVTQRIAASALKGVVKLRPSAEQMQEVTVFSMDAVLSRVQAQLKQNLKKGNGLINTYFCRMVEDFGERIEMFEAIVNAKSAVHLRDFRVVTGRHSRLDDEYGDKPKLDGMNLHHFLELGPTMRFNPFWDELIQLPFYGSNLKKLYAYDYTVRDEGDGRTMYVVKLKSAVRTGAGRLMAGTAFIDAQTQRLLRFQSIVPTVYMTNKFARVAWRTELYSTFIIEYSYDRNGMAEVSNISFDTRGQSVHARGLMFATKGLGLSGIKGQRIEENVIESIESAGFDSIMWEHSNFVQRTNREAEVVNQLHRLQQADSTQVEGQYPQPTGE